MDLSSFVFDLPKDLIAIRPSGSRDSLKLLVVDRKSKKINITKFENIADYPIDGESYFWDEENQQWLLAFDYPE